MALVVFLQEDEDVPSVYRYLKIFSETAPRCIQSITDAKICVIVINEEQIIQEFALDGAVMQDGFEVMGQVC